MMIKNFINYIKDDKFQFKYIENSIKIVNYTEIKSINENIITILSQNNHLIIIKGNNLTINKMTEDEVLIKGSIKSIEM